MNFEHSPGQLFEPLRREGFHVRTFSSGHIREVQNEFDNFHNQGLFDETFYRERLTSFKFQFGNAEMKSKSVIIIAAPQPIILVVFRWMSKDYPVYIPPT